MTSREYYEKRSRVMKAILDIRCGRTTIDSQIERNKVIQKLEKQKDTLKLKFLHSLTYGYGFAD